MQELDGRVPDRVYSTEAIAVEWEHRFCIHAARCIRSLPAVFDPKRRPWIVLDGAMADEVAAAIERCPTGALHYRRLDGGPEEVPADPVTVHAVADGPLFMRGAVTLQTEDGRTVRSDSRMALCRCGASANKPFCDNSHRTTGFHAP